MSPRVAHELSILVLAPTGRDAQLACEVLEAESLASAAMQDVAALCKAVTEGAGAVLLTEEALDPHAQLQLAAVLAQQPAWSDLPIIVFAGAVDVRSTTKRNQHMLQSLGNVTILERPVRIPTLVTAMKAALRARARQYDARRTLEALEQREAELQQASARKDEFLAMLAHELRNPLAAISMALTLLERSNGEPVKSAQHRATARRQMTNLVRLVDDLLDVSRITRGAVELRKERLDLAAIVRNAVAATQLVVDARQHRLSVEMEGGSFPVDADSTRLEQVVTNLITNAAKYTPPTGAIHVSLKRERTEVVVRVKDSGRGIPASMLDHVFDLFVQVDQTIDRSMGGLGLGLTLVKSLVAMHGGTVSARSEGHGCGSEFEIRLPLAGSHTEAVRLASPTPARPPDARRRIVLIDDSDDLRESMKEYLEDLGHEVSTAANGLDGVETVLRVLPDVALVDVGLPGIDGYEVARQVRSAPEGSSLYLVALTGYGGAEATHRALNAGFDLHLTKPVNIQRLQEVVTGHGPEARSDMH